MLSARRLAECLDHFAECPRIDPGTPPESQADSEAAEADSGEGDRTQDVEGLHWSSLVVVRDEGINRIGLYSQSSNCESRVIMGLRLAKFFSLT